MDIIPMPLRVALVVVLQALGVMWVMWSVGERERPRNRVQSENTKRKCGSIAAVYKKNS